MNRMLRILRFKTAKYALQAGESLVKNIRTVDKWIPIFIVGPPRSGTTLIYQTVTTAFKTVFFCNFAELHKNAPLSATLLGYFSISRYQSGFSSTYGASRGRFAPAQGDGLWQSLLAIKADRDPLECEIDQVRKVIEQMCSLYKAPFVNKSIRMSANIAILDKIFPHALYIRVRRDIVDNSMSQLNNLRQNGTVQNSAGDTWVSAKPDNYKELLPLTDEQKVIRQLISLQREMDDYLGHINSQNVLTIDYEEFCKNPGAFIVAVENRYRELGGNLVRKSPVPERFHSHSYADIDNITVKLLRQEVDRLLC